MLVAPVLASLFGTDEAITVYATNSSGDTVEIQAWQNPQGLFINSEEFFMYPSGIFTCRDSKLFNLLALNIPSEVIKVQLQQDPERFLGLVLYPLRPKSVSLGLSDKYNPSIDIQLTPDLSLVIYAK